MKVIIRQARPADAPALSRLNLAYNGKPCIRTRAIARRLAKRGYELTFVALERGEVIGFACVLTTQSWCYDWAHFYIAELYVRPESRRKGVAKKLIRAIQSYSKKHHYHELKISVDWKNAAAKKLYQFCGFKKKGGVELLQYN